MEHIEGESLRDRIARGPVSIADVIATALEVGQGLAAAHAQGIVHRDIKPGNVMLTSDGRAKVLDFGLALAPERTRLTMEGRTTGTVSYMSPEQSRGEAVDHRTDIWSLGVILYEMLTGQRPFAGEHERAVIRSIVNDEPDPPTGLRTGIPLELERVVRKSMAKSPEERYQHFETNSDQFRGMLLHGWVPFRELRSLVALAYGPIHDKARGPAVPCDPDPHSARRATGRSSNAPRNAPARPIFLRKTGPMWYNGAATHW